MLLALEENEFDQLQKQPPYKESRDPTHGLPPQEDKSSLTFKGSSFASDTQLLFLEKPKVILSVENTRTHLPWQDRRLVSLI